MKRFLYLGLVFVLVVVAATYALLYYDRAADEGTSKVFAGEGKVWLLSGESHIFDITNRAISVQKWLFGFGDGVEHWAAVGSGQSDFRPHMSKSTRSDTMLDSEYVVGVVSNGVATAYPMKILAAHQVIDDDTQDPAVTVYYGNVSHAAAAFQAGPGGQPVTMASSGFLYRNVDLLYDLATESLFMPTEGRFVAGDRLGERARFLPCAVVPLGKWRQMYPDSRLMTENTGVPSVTYPRQDVLAKPLALKMKPRLSGPLARYGDDAGVIVLPPSAEGDGEALIPLPEGRALGRETAAFDFEGAAYTVHFADGFKAAWVTDEAGALVPSMRCAWAVAATNMPESKVADLR